MERAPLPLNQVSDFDIRLLRVFKAVVECGGFTAAEVALGIGRSAISVHMGDLEKRLGLRLCQRGRGGFALTEEGREVYQATLALLASLETFRTEVNGLHRALRGELNIGITDNLVSLPQMRITHALAELKRRGPEVRINIHMTPPDAIALAVLDGSLHLGVVPAINSLASLESIPLYSERSLLYCADNHPLFHVDDAALAGVCLGHQEAVMPSYPLPPAARERHERLATSATASDREGIAFLILTGRYIGYLPDHLARPWVESGRLRALCPEQESFTTEFVTVTRRGRRPHRVLEAFLAALAAQGEPADGEE
ncbi:DNA-binding transcriptional regulator, LysR family [Modicisalibacter ilicicola DSM 19980]|uniref:DNA-binding transcriptional regulator, LysR family n=1 Tax=Modicisalibacter ilicicola DSM 19980 TaxID=1121942 RepID=A0A1M5CAY4_9GAMM|nr:LysR family transcriptional regulator [Halomonas ilicicola]SHF51879.1 DNA-binding transcriptional regulator, LysR family [Halomonas ilicicola DSM 19980]